MSKLTVISGLDCVKALKKIGFRNRRQKGRHVVMRRDDPYALVVVPDHDTLAPGTLRKIIRDTGLTVDEFIALVTAQAEKRSVIKGEMTVGGKWVDIRRADFHVNERLTSA